MGMGLLSDMVYVYLVGRPVYRRSERWVRLCLLMNKEFGPRTPQAAIFPFLLLSPCGYVDVVGVEFGELCWRMAGGLKDYIFTGPYFSIS